MPYPAVVLIILDGWGIGPAWGGNAISQAKTPFVSRLWHGPTASLAASGDAVGLPGHERGNSEVGHLNLGAGRVVVQDSTRINRALETGEFERNEVLLGLFKELVTTRKRLHLMGLLTENAVHADRVHAEALIRLAHRAGVADIRVHLFSDGRDSGPRDGLRQVIELEKTTTNLSSVRLQSVTGRYWAMDRDGHWDRTRKAFETIAFGKASQTAPTAKAAFSQSYAQGITDEFIEPTIISTNDAGSYTGVQDGDGVVFWNFRADRARQLTRAFTGGGPKELPAAPAISFLTMTPYGAERDIAGVQVVFQPEKLAQTLAEVLATHKKRQFHIAETEKYAHVTYFFNGGREEPWPNEQRELVQSPKVSTFDQRPAMSAETITRILTKEIVRGTADFYVANFANADMVGHTGNFHATVQAIECLDQQLAAIASACHTRGLPLLITADHGNAEQMVDPKTGEPATDHTTNPVPCHFVLPEPQPLKTHTGRLADVAPTILSMLALPVPKEMTGMSLF